MSKELADRLEKWLNWDGTDSTEEADEKIREAIAALRSEPVAWLDDEGTVNATSVRPISLEEHRAFLADHPSNGRPLYAAPSRETAKPKVKCVECQGGECPTPNLCAEGRMRYQQSKPEAEPALSAEQKPILSAEHIEHCRKAIAGQSEIINTLCDMALSSLTARDEGIEAAALLAEARKIMEPWPHVFTADGEAEAAVNLVQFLKRIDAYLSRDRRG